MKPHTPLAVACLLFSTGLAPDSKQNSAQQNGAPAEEKRQSSGDQNAGAAPEADLRRLLELIGAPQASAQIVQQTLALKKKFAPRTLTLTNWRRETFQTALETKIQARFTADALAARWAPIYARHFSPEEIQAILQFYESAAGRKLLAEQPAILQESFSAAQEWRRETVADILKEMAVEFPGARESEQALQVTAH